MAPASSGGLCSGVSGTQKSLLRRLTDRGFHLGPCGDKIPTGSGCSAFPFGQPAWSVCRFSLCKTETCILSKGLQYFLSFAFGPWRCWHAISPCLVPTFDVLSCRPVTKRLKEEASCGSCATHSQNKTNNSKMPYQLKWPPNSVTEQSLSWMNLF